MDRLNKLDSSDETHKGISYPEQQEWPPGESFPLDLLASNTGSGTSSEIHEKVHISLIVNGQETNALFDATGQTTIVNGQEVSVLLNLIFKCVGQG